MKNFGVIIAVVLSLFISSNLVAQEKMARGKIVVSIGDDFKNKKSEVKYFLQRQDATLVPVSMEHIGDSPPPRPGQRAILSPNGKLHYFRNDATGITFNKISGKIRVLIALIQPSDEDVPWEAEKAKEYFQSSKDFFEDPHQHSKVELELSVVGWVQSQKTKSELTSSTNSNFLDYSLINEAVGLVDDSVDFNEVDCLFIVVADNDWTWTGAWASIGKPNNSTDDGYCQFSNIRIGSDFFSNNSQINSHELGHALFSQYHAAGMNTNRENECGYSGEAEEYKGLDVMGYVYFFLSTIRQYLLGWLSEERVAILSNSSSVELCPREVENAYGKQLVIIIEKDNNSYFTIELCEKKSETYNNNDLPLKNGYELLVNEHGDVGYGGYDFSVFLKKDNDYESFLHPGEEICGLGVEGNISIRYVSLEGEGEEARAKVEVTIEGAPEPTPTPSSSPTPSPTPSPSPIPSPSPSPTPEPSPTPPPIPTPTPTPSVTLSPTPHPTPTEPATGDVVRLNLDSANMAKGKLILRKRESIKVSVETLAKGPFGDIPVPNVAVEAKVGGKKKRISIYPLSSLTDENGQGTFIITAKKKTGIAKIIFKAGNVEKSLIAKVK